MTESDPKKSNFFPLWFYVATVTTPVADTEMSIAGEATAAAVPQQPIPWAGSIVGMSCQLQAAIGAGTATVYPTINGVTAASSLVFDATTNPQYTAASWRRGLYPITRNQRLGAQYTTTGAFTSATNSLVACVWVHVEETV
jgi:hypothetical protein